MQSLAKHLPIVMTISAVVLTAGMMMQRLAYVEAAVKPISQIQIDIAIIKQAIDLKTVVKK